MELTFEMLYEAASGEAACSSCADMASSAVVSDKQEDCKCVAGYSGPDGMLQGCIYKHKYLQTCMHV